MPGYVAFLRAMNVGGRRVTNDELCKCFEGMGFERVAGFLASGNVMFESGRRSSAKLESQIEAGLHSQLGYEVPTFVRSSSEVIGIAASQPFAEALAGGSAGKLQVALLPDRPAQSDREAAMALATPDDLLAIDDREMYWLPKGTMSDSELDLKALGRILGPMTIRTHRTMVRLAAKVS